MTKYECSYDCPRLTVSDALTKLGFPDEVIMRIIKLTTKKEKCSVWKGLEFWFTKDIGLAFPLLYRNNNVPIVHIDFIPPIDNIVQEIGHVQRHIEFNQSIDNIVQEIGHVQMHIEFIQPIDNIVQEINPVQMQIDEGNG